MVAEALGCIFFFLLDCLVASVFQAAFVFNGASLVALMGKKKSLSGNVHILELSGNSCSYLPGSPPLLLALMSSAFRGMQQELFALPLCIQRKHFWGISEP